MRLIASLTSPFARKVRVVLLETQIPCELTVDIPWTAETQVPNFNPLGKVPVLVLDDGSSLFDSRVIVEYLDALAPAQAILPADRLQAIAVRRWEALADGIGDAAAAIFLEHKRPVAQQSADWIARQQQKINLGLDALATQLGDHEWCHGGQYSLADIAVGCNLGYLDLRFAELGWRNRHPNLARLAERLAQRPAFAQTIPQG